MVKKLKFDRGSGRAENAQIMLRNLNAFHLEWGILCVCVGLREWKDKETEIQTVLFYPLTMGGDQGHSWAFSEQIGRTLPPCPCINLHLLLSVQIPIFCSPGSKRRHMSGSSKTALGYFIR